MKCNGWDTPSADGIVLTQRVSAYPILDKASFLAEFDRTYECTSPETDFLWCAMVNTVLAIGCRVIPGSNEEQICNLFTNALNLFAKVAFAFSTLRKVQTLTLMVRTQVLADQEQD